MKKIHQLGVLQSYINIQLLDYLKESYENGNNSAQELIGSFSKRKQWDDKITLNCISCKGTTLSLLAGLIFFIRSNDLPAREQDKYAWYDHLEMEGVDDPQTELRMKAILIIRNAIAHWDEGGSGVEFLDSATRFKSRAGTLVIKDEGLHLLIMQMYSYAQSAYKTQITR